MTSLTGGFSRTAAANRDEAHSRERSADMPVMWERAQGSDSVLVLVNLPVQGSLGGMPTVPFWPCALVREFLFVGAALQSVHGLQAEGGCQGLIPQAPLPRGMSGHSGSLGIPLRMTWLTAPCWHLVAPWG
jgi:hypothetical protein